MNQISAKLICYSTSHLQTPIATIQIRIPLIIQAEFNTHRVFSRSFNSSRAIPAKTMRKSADFEPEQWLSNQPGMTGGDELQGIKKHIAIAVWETLTAIVKCGHRILDWCGLHKQYTNRWLSTVVWVDGVVTSTEWSNFLKLRNHPNAQPEIRELARQIAQILADNEPDFLEPGEWHLPYIDAEDIEANPFDDEDGCENLALISAGRCARVSYGFKAVKDSWGDERRAKMLLSANPKHFSPFEHQAIVQTTQKPFKSGNFRNWEQFRQRLEKE
jgi:hypothetical protein